MKRIAVSSHQNWQNSLARTGFDYQAIDPSYWHKNWQDGVCYVFDESQIDELKRTTEELHQMYFTAACHVIKTGDYTRLGIGNVAADLIEQSFHPDTPTLYGRFDLCYDGISPPKLYEYNADTPTLILESGLAQWHWLNSQSSLNHAKQFNRIHECLLVEFKALKTNSPMYFAAMADETEDFIATRYLQDTARQAGLNTCFIDVGDIGHDQTSGNFVDLYNTTIRTLFKLYPWEWLLQEEFGQYISNANTVFIEPAYKLLYENKALLAILWELFPNHPNLLPAHLEPNKLKGDFIQKPFFSRQGTNITLHTECDLTQADNPHNTKGFVYQQAKQPPTFTKQNAQIVHTIIGSWIIGHGAAGIGIRESRTAITDDDSVFVPHIFH